MVQYYPVSHIVDEKYSAKTKALSNEVWTKKLPPAVNQSQVAFLHGRTSTPKPVSTQHVGISHKHTHQCVS
jgi:hypothetical protein